MKNISKEALDLLAQQKVEWQMCGDNYAALSAVESKKFEVNGYDFHVQFNPARIRSSAAKVDPRSIAERKCFLCPQNRPEVQRGINIITAQGNLYTVLVNPFPIFPEHFTVPTSHTDQRIAGRAGDMADVAMALRDFVVFYNGPQCGASAPDHFHFQAGNKGFLPTIPAEKLEKIEEGVFIVRNYPAKAILLIGSKKDVVREFEKIFERFEAFTGGSAPEPMLNILCWAQDDLTEGEQITMVIFPRKGHRPRQFFEEGEKNILISPASVDLGGVFITPQQKDFEKITSADIADILEQITVTDEVFEKLI